MSYYNTVVLLFSNEYCRQVLNARQLCTGTNIMYSCSRLNSCSITKTLVKNSKKRMNKYTL